MFISRYRSELYKQDADVIAKKIANARLFEDDNNELNFNIQQMNGEILSVSQFTLYADVKKGNRPGFSNSKNPDQAVKIYEYFDALRLVLLWQRMWNLEHT